MKFQFGKLSGFLLYGLIFFSLFSFWSCQKEASFENPNGPGGGIGEGDSAAIFTLVPSGASCSDAIVSGIYAMGSPISPTDLVNVSVNVTKKGNWTYSTGMVNGISFSGSGNFSATGVQRIILLASGLPRLTLHR